MFERTEVAKQVYEERTPSQTPTRAEAKRDGHVRKRKGGEYDSPTIPEKGRADKRRTKMQAIRAMRPTKQKIHACCMASDTPQRSVNY